MELQGFQVDVAQLQGAYLAEGLVKTPQHDPVAPVGTAGQPAAVVFAVVVEVVPGVFRECGHVLHASLRWVDPLADALVVERDEVVLLVEPSECLRLVFQAEVPADLLPRVERVDVSRLEGGGVAVRVPADDYRSPFPAFRGCGLFSVSFIGVPPRKWCGLGCGRLLPSPGRQAGENQSMFSWVPVSASWKTSVTGRFPKDRKPWNKAKNSWPRLPSEVRMITVVIRPSFALPHVIRL